MLYELITASPRMRPSFQVCERPKRYRRRSRARRSTADVAVPTDRIELAVRSREGGSLWRRVMRLNTRFSANLTDDLRTTWLKLEELLQEYWLQVATEHYRSGFEAGLTQASKLLDESSRLDVRARLRVVIATLDQLVTALEEQERST